MASAFLFPVYLTLICFISYPVMAWGLVDPTEGFTSLPLNESNFLIQRPYNVPEDQRYSFIDGVRKLWVYQTDKPHTPTSKTHPRTEIRIHGYDYSSGVWQFEGYGYVPCGTSGVCIMQVFGASAHATTLMLRVYNGTLSYYRSQVLVPDIYDRWFRLNVIHDVEAGNVKVYIDGFPCSMRPAEGEPFTISNVECMHRMMIPSTWSHVGEISRFLRKCD